MNQKGLTPILIVVLMAVLAVGGYLIYKLPRASVTPPTPQTTPAPSPTPTSNPVPNGTGETTNWKTFTNQKHRISFRYPLEWNPIPDQLALILGPKGERLIFNDDGSLMNECMEDTSASEVNIANVIFTKTTFKGIKFGAACAGGTLGKKEIWIQPKSKQFGLQFEYLDSNAQEVEKIFDRILSTFKFLP